MSPLQAQILLVIVAVVGVVTLMRAIEWSFSTRRKHRLAEQARRAEITRIRARRAR